MQRTNFFAHQVAIPVKNDNSHVLFEAVRDGNVSLVQTLFLNGASAQAYLYMEAKGHSYLAFPLLTYFFQGLEPLVNMLADTSNHTAAELEQSLSRVHGYLKIAELLINKGIDPDAPPTHTNAISDTSILYTDDAPRRQAAKFIQQIERCEDHELKAPLLQIVNSINALPKREVRNCQTYHC